MKILIDTAVMIFLARDERDNVAKTALELLADGNNECFVSLVSVWETAIKSALGKLPLGHFTAESFLAFFRATGLTQLPLRLEHCIAVHSLPLYHRDPFDRLLIAQAQCDKMTIITPDKEFKKYKVKTAW